MKTLEQDKKIKMPKKHTVGRILKYLFKYYKASLIVVIVCILFSSVASVSASVFLQYIIDSCITPALTLGLGSIWAKLVQCILIMAAVYVAGLLAAFIYSRIMAVITHKFLKQIREDMFNKMQSLPIKFFDTHTHGDTMSAYTNDTDALLQLVAQSIPQICASALTIIVLFGVMLFYSIWLTIIVLVCVGIMLLVTAKIGGKSALYFVKQQKSLGKTEGYIEEMMNGQKVVKVFCHEHETKREFDKINEELCKTASSANKYANILMPILNNIGNIMYVVIAFIGGAMSLAGFLNVSLVGLSPLSIGIVISFLTMSRSFSNSISQVSQQVNYVVMARAGAERIFALMDEPCETDDGYVTLVNAEEKNGILTESKKRTGIWAWKHPHKSDNSITYTKLRGNILLDDVDFGYEENKMVLHGVTVDAKAGQKIAFVGSTGAGKTTITNLINRFYDIADGKIRYDGININKIRKADLRRSLGMVLQDTNLFTGSVMENIRYGKLDATDEECIAAARLANAHDFILRLPEGYKTLLSADGANLSQGQRQLLSIARAAVADAPVMIMDEATSSIDTRTEAIVQKGTDRLMQGRTVFVIAHRLSTVQNSDVIMVLEHGVIIERGSHEQLINNKGKYYQLYTGAFELE